MIKIELPVEAKIPRKTESWINGILEALPREHLRGLERIRLVEAINDPRVKNLQQADLPGLYHPKQGTKSAWIEVATGVLIPKMRPFTKRIIPRLSFKGNLAAIIYSLVGQHYYLTLRHSIKRGQIEPAVRSYTEKYLRIWHEHQHTVRSRLFKPIQPTLEKWGRSLQKRATQERKRKRVG
ncbi:MAG: hypothetical protein DMF68_01180 [Acidobacteria bacterium]|nr:MAG: hypothetical protein DMF68_01180 [Acidobacteriota bacterium]